MARLGGSEGRGNFGIGAADRLPERDQDGDGDHGNEGENESVLDESLSFFISSFAVRFIHYAKNLPSPLLCRFCLAHA